MVQWVGFRQTLIFSSVNSQYTFRLCELSKTPHVCFQSLTTPPEKHFLISHLSSHISVSLYVSETKPWHAQSQALQKKEKRKTASIRNKSAISKLHASVQTDSSSDKCNNIKSKRAVTHSEYNTSSFKPVLTLFDPLLQWRKGGWSSYLLNAAKTNTPEE